MAVQSWGYVVSPLAAMLVACSGHSGSGDSTQVDAVTVTPAHVVVGAGASMQFEAVVTGKGAIPQAVTWSVAPSDNAGRVSQVGRYEAPLRAVAGVQVIATSVLQPSRRGQATVDVVAPSVAISPRTVETMLGDTVQFAPVFEGGVVTAVEWHCVLGTIDSHGLYRAPEQAAAALDTVTVRALASGAMDTATVSLKLRPPMLSGTSGPAGPGDALTVYGTGFQGDVVVLLPAQAGDPIPVPGIASPDHVVVTVPTGVVSGPLRAELHASGFTPVVSEAIPFERAPRLRLHLPTADLSAGESTRVQVAFLGVPGSVPLTYHADAGTFAGDEYTAPVGLMQTATVNVSACVAGTTICSGATVAIHPFRVDPSPAIVPAGGSQTFSAQVAGMLHATRFSLVSGGGTVTTAGAYSAPGDVADAGPAWLSGDDGADTELVQVGITGFVPGLLVRLADYVDTAAIGTTPGLPWGNGAWSVAGRGNRLYVLSTRIEATAQPDMSLAWIDVYDVSDPLRPQWVGAVESAALTGSLAVWNDHLYLIEGGPVKVSAGGSVTVYDISGPLPVPIARDARPSQPGNMTVSTVTADATSVYRFDAYDSGAGTVQLLIHDLTAAPLPTPREVTLALPPDARPYQPDPSFAALDGRAYAAYEGLDLAWRLGAWDISLDPPSFLGSVPASFTFGMTFAGPFILAGGYLYDRRTPVPSNARGLPFYWVNARVLSGDGQRFLLSEDGRLYVLDVSDPANPIVTTSVGGPSLGVLHQGVLYGAEGVQGLTVYDVLTPGGPIPRAVFGLPDLLTYFNAVKVRGGYLYAVGFDRELGGFLGVWDLATSPPTLASAVPLATSGFALAFAGDRLLVGRPDGLEVRSLVDPTSPALVASSPMDLYSLAADGDLAWVATSTGDLVSIDLTSPGGPVELGRLPLGALARDIEVLGSGRLALALHSASLDTGDLAVIDVSNPAAPALLASAGLSAPVFDIAMAGSTAFLGTAGGTLTVDLSDPAHPAVLAFAPIPADAQTFEPPLSTSVAVHDGIVWVGTYGTRALLLGYDARAPGVPRGVMRSELTMSGVASSFLGLAFDGARAFATVTQDTPFGIIHELVEIDAAQPRNLVMTLAAPPSLPR